jgi:hypothetical protein
MLEFVNHSCMTIAAMAVYQQETECAIY